MTRETKVGLVVAGSFLCLVCIVVASKMRPADEPPRDGTEESTVSQVAAITPHQNTPAPDVKKQDGPPPEGKREIKKDNPPAPKNPPPKNTDTPPPAPPGSGISLAPPPSVPLVDMTPPPGGALPLPPPVLAKDTKNNPKPPTADPSTDAPGISIVPPPLPKSNDHGAPPPPNPFSEVGKVPDIEAASTFQGPGSLVPPAVKKEPGEEPIKKKETDAPPIVAFPPPTGIDPPGFPPIDEKKNPTASPAFPKEGNPPGAPLGQPTPITPDGAPKVPSLTGPSNGDKPAIVPPLPDTRPDMPIARIPPTDLPSTPPIGGNPGKLEPITKKDASGRPMPIVRDLETHKCEPGETTMAALSKRFYGDEKYADALLQYNRANYKATNNGVVFLANTPTLKPGQEVQIAPANILERDYPTLVRTATIPMIPPTSTLPPTSAAPGLARPTPINPGVATVSNPPGPRQAGTYVVQSPTGESILDIAERVLGDRGQWNKIWRVNPSYPPNVRIPAGTKIEIPAS